MSEEVYEFVRNEKKLVDLIIKFINEKENVRISEININFCYPNTSYGNSKSSLPLPPNGKGGGVLDIFNDFIFRVSLISASSTDTQTIFERNWQEFQQDFFSEELTILFLGQIASFSYSAGGDFANLLNTDGLELAYLNQETCENQMLFHRTNVTLQSNPFCETYKNEFIASTPVVAKYKLKCKKTNPQYIYQNQALEMFEKITFAIRVIVGGSVHFDFVRPFFMGNYMENIFVANMHENHLFLNNNEFTSLNQWVDEVLIKRLWLKLKNDNFTNYYFINQKIRDSHCRTTEDDYKFGIQYQAFRHIERLVDLIQALESTIGDYSGCNIEYVARLIKRPQLTQTNIKEKMKIAYRIRNKYLHGKFTGQSSVEQIFKNKFKGEIKELETFIHTIEYFLRQVIIYKIINKTFCNKIKHFHHNKCHRPIYRVKHTKFCMDKFPRFKTIYY